jgi:hypothetical protein
MLPHYIKRISAAIYKHTEFESRLRKSKKRDKAKQNKMSAENLINTVGFNVQMIIRGGSRICGYGGAWVGEGSGDRLRSPAGPG